MKYKYSWLCFLLPLYLLSCSCKSNSADPEHAQDMKDKYGLHATAGGELMLNGAPYRGVGVNYFSAFYRVLLSSNWMDTTYKAGFRYLKSQGVPFIRFMACGFWPVDWNVYLANKTHYFRRLDEFVRDAEECGIGLIPSLFWHQTTISDLVGEPRNQWGNPASKTIAFMRDYTREVVTRYKDSPAIWAWEFGNEMNLTADISYTKVASEKGTPEERTPADKTYTSDIVTALTEFAKEVRKLDSWRIILSGNSNPRFSAWHLMQSGTWDPDSISRYRQMISIQNPDPLNTITMHLYPSAEGQYFADHTASLKEIIQTGMSEAEKVQKPLFLGEFGAPLTLGEEEENLKFRELIDAIEDLKVPLSALWVFDLSSQDADWNITPTSRRNYMIVEIGKLNKRIH